MSRQKSVSFEQAFQRAQMAAMGYEAAKKEAQALEEAVSETGKLMKGFPHDVRGLPLESVRVTPEYQTLRREMERRWQKLRAFNGVFVTVFAKEIKRDRAEIARARQAR